MRKHFNIVKSLFLNKFSFIALMLFFASSYNNLFSQAATATWASTANGNVITTGNVTATAHTFSAGLNVPTYDATYGARATNFGGGYCTPTMTRYYEYTVSPSGCNDLEVTLVTFIGRSSAMNRCFQMFYSINGGAESQIGGSYNMTASNTNFNFTSGAISIIVAQGETITFRLYGSGSTASTLGSRNFQVTGTTTASTAVPSVVISAVPGSTICAGTSVTFTATPTVGGASPSYQWKLNGVNVGSNSPNYTNAALANGNTISCVLTSNSPCASPLTATSNTITMTVNPIPSNPGIITGPTSAGPESGGLNYYIDPVAGATTYNWTVPAGWSIDGGSGTTVISVTSGALGQNGNISVTASNACGTSSASSLAVSVIPPHNTCNQCHINHTAPAGQLTAINGNSNLCINCHNPSGTASNKPFTNAMKAIPGTSGTSHQWDIASVNPTYQTNLTTIASLLLRLPGDSIICSTCHNQHTTAPGTPFLREISTSDELCKDCHSARVKTTYAMNSSNKGTHPIDIPYNIADSRFQSTLLPMSTGGNVICSSCHKVHASSSNDGNLLRNSSQDDLCADCHTYQGYATTLDHKGMTCTTCHYAHRNGSTNIYLLNDNINTPNSGSQPVSFSTNTAAADYADASGTANGVCEVCHTLTDHYTNTNGGTADARHMPATQKCVTCHPHSQGFYAQTDCFQCHNTTQDKPGVGPAGGRRQIVDANGNGTGAGGDFKRTSHHVNGAIPNVNDCIKCHYMGDHKKGNIKLFDPDQGYLNIITYDPADKSSVETFCINCHDSNGANGDVTPFSDNVTVPIIDANMWNASSHKGNATTSTCLNCHDNGHGSNKSTMLTPYTKVSDGSADPMDEEEEFCLACHGSGGSASVKVHLAFSSYTNTATRLFKHDPTAYYRKHDAGETAGSAFGGANRHIECVDCHNPHGVKAGTATAPTLLPTLTGARGVEPTYSGAGAPTGFVWQNSVSQEYQVCYKCHSSYTTLPSYTPDGFRLTAFLADGLKKVTTGGTNLQIADSRDMAQEYNPSNLSFHPVMAAGKNLNINAGTFQAGFNYTSQIYCSDCHTNENAGAGYGRGPHGANNLHILDNGTGAGTNYNYVSAHGGGMANQYEVCSKCHQVASYYTNDNNSRFQFHNYHTTKEGCFVCHDTHGSENYHLMNFSRNEGSFTAVNPNSTDAFRHAAGTATNSCVCTCHGTSHSTGSKTYNPSY